MFSFFKKKKPLIQESIAKEVEDYTDIRIIATYFKNETGVTFEHQMSILENKVLTFCKLRAISSFKKLRTSIEHDTKLKQELVDLLTTNETFFYRELRQIMEFVTLAQHHSGDIKILCAPCATGEEPYSLAIALLEAGVSAKSFSIVGIDINADALQKAQEAKYRERNVRNLNAEIISKYFKKNDKKHENLYILSDEIKSLVTFKLINLFDPSFASLGKFDFIFSRNMLIYFDKETKLKAKNILDNMRQDTKYPVFFGHADLF